MLARLPQPLRALGGLFPPEHWYSHGSLVICFPGVCGYRKRRTWNKQRATVRCMVVATQSPADQDAVVDGAVRWLTERLPASWTVGRAQRMPAALTVSQARLLDVAIDVRASNGTVVTLAVEARRSLEPRDVELLLSGLARSLRSVAGSVPILVVAPWLSARTRRALEAGEVNFIDLTGNALITLENPMLYLRSDGAQRNPAPAARGQVRVRGPKAARLVRLLADVRPPYGIRELASATGLVPGYVSQLVGALDRQALIDRERRGGVHGADVAGLLRRWAESYELFATNTTFPFLAAGGPVEVVPFAVELRGGGPVISERLRA